MREAQELQTLLDASVLINLLATETPYDLFKIAKRRFVVVPEVIREVRATGESAQRLGTLLESRQVQVTSSCPGHTDLFVELVGADPPDDLGDGEASTIAYGVLSKAHVAIDERKARRICRERFAELKVISTAGILRELQHEELIELDHLRRVAISALREGRMRVLPEHLEWIFDLLGAEACKECPSLPSWIRVGERSRTI